MAADRGDAGSGSDDSGARRSKKTSRKAFLLRLSPELLGELKTWAANDFRSLNGQIEYLLRQAVRKRKGDED